MDSQSPPTQRFQIQIEWHRRLLILSMYTSFKKHFVFISLIKLASKDVYHPYGGGLVVRLMCWRILVVESHLWQWPAAKVNLHENMSMSECMLGCLMIKWYYSHEKMSSSNSGVLSTWHGEHGDSQAADHDKPFMIPLPTAVNSHGYNHEAKFRCR